MTCSVIPALKESKVCLNPRALGQIYTKVESWLGHVDLSFGELKELQLGDVLVVNRGLREPVELKIAGEISFKGNLGLSNQCLSIQLLGQIETEEQQAEENENDFVSVIDNSTDESEPEFDWEKL